MMKNIAIILIAFLVLGNAKLLLDRHFVNLETDGNKDNVGGNGYHQDIDQTTCNVVDITPILPPGQSNSQYVVRSGFNLVQGKEGSAFGFIFYGAMEAKGDASKLSQYPTLIWLQGGPGGSSQFGDFTEMGPILVKGMNGSFTYTYNKHSWNQKFNIIFIDNPLGTGFSYANDFSDIPVNQGEVAYDFYQGLESLYNDQNGCFNVLNLRESPLFITGESYAGKYVPSIASYILAQRSSSIIRQALKRGGIAVGDGFTDPQTIMDQLPEFGYNLSLLNQKQRNKIQWFANQGDKQLNKGNSKSAKPYFDLSMNFIAQYSGINDPYNWGSVENAPSDFDIDGWLNDPKIKTNVFQFPADMKYTSSSNSVYSALTPDFMRTNVVKSVEKILEQDFPVLYYNGQNDIIVCTPCTTRWLDQVVYPGNNDNQFANTPYKTWNAFKEGQEKVSGYWKQSENLIFATINQAGHLVPTDQPEAAYTLLTAYVDYALKFQKGQKNISIFDKEEATPQQQETEILQ